MATADPYETLGVARTATQDQIKNAYRALAKKYHPDLNPGKKDAERKFKELSAAYELIGTPETRAKFDRGEIGPEAEAAAAAGAGYSRRGPFYSQTHAGAGGGGRYSFSFGSGGAGGFDEDLFASIFGGRGGYGETGPVPGQDELYRMDIELRDAVTGGEREITLPGGKRLRVRIPAGVSEGTRLRFSGQATPGQGGGPAGDVYVELHFRPDERFRIEGSDLIAELPVGIDIAVLGGEVLAPTVEGQVRLKIPRRTSSGRKLRLGGKGLYDRRTGKRGDEIVVVQVVLPEGIDAELEAALQAWRQRHERSAA